jgi:uncharacterized repeat protein (TIGR01451 family)
VIVSVFVLLTGVADAQPTADLAVTVVGSPPVATIGDTVTFVITAINNGPDASAATQLTDQPPAELAGLTWSCSSANGVTCPVLSGTGRVDLTTAFPATGTLTITMSGTVTFVPPAGRIADQASVNSTAPGLTDPILTNNFGQAAVPVVAPPTTTTTTTTTTAATTTTPPAVPPTTAPASTTSTPTPSTALPATATTADVNAATTTDSTVLPTTGQPLRLMTLSALLAVALGCGVFVAAVGRRRGDH